MIVEVKTKPYIGDITEHLERMKKIRSYADLHNDKRKFLGAIAGMVNCCRMVCCNLPLK
jgi:hypothetical protein